MGRDLCRITLGGKNHCPFVYFDSFLTIITTFPKTLFADKLYATLFGVPGVLDHESLAS